MSKENDSTIFYFAYGSNMSLARIKARDIEFQSRKPCLLKDYQLVFNIKDFEVLEPSIDCKKGYANIVPQAGSEVEGFLYSLSEEQFQKLATFEEGYEKLEVKPMAENIQVSALAFVGASESIGEGLLPPSWYMDYLLEAANLLSSTYQRHLASIDVLIEDERI